MANRRFGVGVRFLRKRGRISLKERVGCIVLNECKTCWADIVNEGECFRCSLVLG